MDSLKTKRNTYVPIHETHGTYKVVSFWWRGPLIRTCGNHQARCSMLQWRRVASSLVAQSTLAPPTLQRLNSSAEPVTIVQDGSQYKRRRCLYIGVQGTGPHGSKVQSSLVHTHCCKFAPVPLKNTPAIVSTCDEHTKTNNSSPSDF